MKPLNLFEGSLVRLRAYEPEDAEALFRHRQDSEVSRRDARINPPSSLAHIRRHLENPGDPSPSDNRDLLIETLDGRLVGGIDIEGANPTNGTFSVGIGLPERSEWGKGYAKEAMLLVMRFMFHERRYQKCNLSVYAFNHRAIHLYRHMGFQEEGRRRRQYFSAGAYHDELYLGMTREEFDEQYPEWTISVEENPAHLQSEEAQ